MSGPSWAMRTTQLNPSHTLFLVLLCLLPGIQEAETCPLISSHFLAPTTVPSTQ